MSSIVLPDAATLQQAATILRAGGVVGFPTETYYGLAVDPFNQQAVDRLYTLKRRSGALPILLLVATRQQVTLVAQTIPPAFSPLIEHFWPGPLSLIFPAKPICSSRLTGGTGTIAARHSPHPLANQLLHTYGAPVTATSANISGQPAATNAQDLLDMFDGQVDLILDGGKTPGGQGSTLVGLKDGLICCFRAGKIDFSLVEKVTAAYNLSISR